MATAYPRNYECRYQVCRKDVSLGTLHSANYILFDMHLRWADNNIVHLTN